MKSMNRHIYIHPDFHAILKERSIHMDDGIPNDPFIPEDKSFSIQYNRSFLKAFGRISDFLRKASKDEIEKYLKDSLEIQKEDFQGLYAYSPKDSNFKIYFLEVKNRIREDEYKFLYALAKKESLEGKDLKKDISLCYEWKKEYTPTEMQKRIANYEGHNIVLGAAGTGKTDVAIHAYINAANPESITGFTAKENVFITYSEKLKKHVERMLDDFWNDYKNPIAKNIYTTKDFFIQVLGNAGIEIPGYTLNKGKYIRNEVKKPKEEDYLENQIVDVSCFIQWMKEGFKEMNRALVPSIEAIVEKMGSDYPYLFYRGIYKGKIINKVSDLEITEFFTERLGCFEKEFQAIRRLWDNYIDGLDENPTENSFSTWYNLANKRYANEFRMIPSSLSKKEDFYAAFQDYFDFANPIREDKRSLEYYGLFKREASLIEGYRGEVREEFQKEMKDLYQMCLAFDSYTEKNQWYDDNDLCYWIIQNLEQIREGGIYKNILLDEFQDVTERQLHTLVRLTQDDEEMGILHVYGDFEQTINPTFLQLESIETIYMVNGIESYEKQILSSSFRYSSAICRELEALREFGKKLFGREDAATYLPLVSNVEKEFETGGNLLTDFSIGDEMLKKIAASKELESIMFIVSDAASKQEFLSKYKVDSDVVFTISESKGREADYVICYKLCSSKAMEYENLFTKDNSYSRAGRIFYNQLYVGITRCKINFLQIEDERMLGPKTKECLEGLITPLLKENAGIFLEELLSSKINYYFRARDSFKNLDFAAARDNLTFYSGEDYDSLREVLSYIEEKDQHIQELSEFANRYKEKNAIELARVLYIVLDNLDMLRLLDQEKLTDEEIEEILKKNKQFLSDVDMKAISKTGYFDRKTVYLKDKISKIQRRRIQ